jgi:hypothetical protein
MPRPEGCQAFFGTHDLSWTERYKATDGFLPKPQNQISLHNGGLEQNPGWDIADPTTQYKGLY